MKSDADSALGNRQDLPAGGSPAGAENTPWLETAPIMPVLGTSFAILGENFAPAGFCHRQNRDVRVGCTDPSGFPALVGTLAIAERPITCV